MSRPFAPTERAAIAGLRPETPAWRAARGGFESIAGSPRLLLYDLSASDAPNRLTRTGIALRGSPRWYAYLARRRRLDTGDLTLVLALRRLEREERLLVIDWGTAHANAFILVEPRVDGVDLSNPSDPTARQLRAAAEDAARDGDGRRLESLLRRMYGSWVYWPDAPATEDSCRRLELNLDEPGSTVHERLQAALPSVFPPRAFDQRLRQLLQFESELFTGRSVERARSPFLTRLGLPAVYEPSLVTGALRRMVNEGRLSAFVAGCHGAFHGPEAPIPDDVPDELFERMLL